MLYFSALESEALALLRRLMTLDLLKDTMLVGGTALALQIGHRKSIDLDIFGKVSMENFEAELPFPIDLKIKQISSTKNIRVYVIDGIKVDIVNYKYPWLDEPVVKDGLRLASEKDIAAMKLSAIAGRGTKKDFVDLSFLQERYSLEQLMKYYLDKYHGGSEFLVVKSLGYFSDAEKDEMPEMIIKKSWSQVKSEITTILKNYIS